jgi:ubiquinone biosynthesis protein COQ4
MVTDQCKWNSAVTDMKFIRDLIKYRYRPLVAISAIRGLIRDKEDTAQVFRMLVALRGRSYDRNLAQFTASPVGAKVLCEKRNLVDQLSDRPFLEALPPESLGRAFLAFLDGCGITPQGLNDAAREAGLGDESMPEDTLRYEIRLRVQHDLWHVIGGYGCDGFGEVCNLAFSYPHSRNIGMMVLAIAGAHNYSKAFPGEPIWAAMWEGYRRGKRVTWLPAVDWEAMLPKPVAEVRAALGITDLPSHYIAAPKVIAASGTMAPALA